MIITDDCVAAMERMDPDSIDAIVTDPPYGLEFMGKEWDRLAVGARMSPRLTMKADEPVKGDPWASERTSYGTPKRNPRCRNCGRQKFNHPKSRCQCDKQDWDMEGWHHNIRIQEWHEAWARAAYRVAKPSAYLLAFGGTRTVHRLTCALEDAGWIIRDLLVWGYASGFPKSKASLKPAWEPIVMARKPGPLRELAIDACRLPVSDDDPVNTAIWTVREDGPAAMPVAPDGTRLATAPKGGRWPANIVLTDPIFDGGWEGVVGGGAATTGGNINGRPVTGYGGHWADSREFDGYGDSGTYSRFFSIPAGPLSLPSGTMVSCQSCGAPIVDRSSTDATRPVVTAPLNADTPPSESPAQSVPDAVGLFDSPVTDIAPRPAPTRPGGMPGSTVNAAKSPTGTDTSVTAISTSPAEPPGTTSRSTRPVSPAVEPHASSDTMTTTQSPWMCGSCADSAIGDSTRHPKTHSGRVLLPVEEPSYPRFYLVAKADRADREPVLGGQARERRTLNHGLTGVSGDRSGRGGRAEPLEMGTSTRANFHPTVKPTDLMRHLVRLVTPAGGTVLDPFLGSGTTALACELEGFPWVGIEREEEYVRIAEARLNGVQKGLGI